MTNLDWGRRRQRLIELVFGLCGIGIIAVVLTVVLYKAPSCMDGIQNQGETGIDCGGPCPNLCSVDETPLKVTFVRPVSPQAGRTDVIAYIENHNANASVQSAKYTVQVYNQDGPDQIVMATKTGTVSIPPSSTVPLFIPDVYQGKQPIVTAFLSFDPSTIVWMKNSSRPIVPVPSNIQILTGTAPKVIATLSNPSVYPFYNEVIVATVFNAQGNAIAASQTVVPTLSAKGSSQVVFTWNTPFTSKPVRVEFLPSFQ